MDFLTHLRQSIANLLSSKLRSFLAILGVLVGTGSVVALISSSQLATAHALDQFKSLGTNLLSMSVQQPPSSANSNANQEKLRLVDMPKLLRASKEIVSAAPYINAYAAMNFRGMSINGQILGATQQLGHIAKVPVSSGRFVSSLDKQQLFCVVGSKVAEKIRLKGVDPLGKQLQVGSKYFTIIGIAKPWTPNLFLFSDINDGIIIPLRASYLISPSASINNVLFRLIKKPNLKAVQQKLKLTMSELFPKLQVQFRNPEQIIQIVAKQRKTFTWLLGAIGGISLIVGGIGVMNIMLVSVVERRREIGVRMAIGAKRADIMKMFLIESVMLTVFGGVLGIAVGVLASFILALVTGWEFQFFLLPVLLGFIVSFLVGILSGFYPSWRASRLDPIQTLQAE